MWNFHQKIPGKNFVYGKNKFHFTYSVSQKNPPVGLRFSDIFHKGLRIFNQFLHTYHTFPSTLDYKFLFNYLQLYRGYAILNATT